MVIWGTTVRVCVCVCVCAHRECSCFFFCAMCRQLTAKTICNRLKLPLSVL